MGLGGSGNISTSGPILRVHAMALDAAFGPGSCRNLVVRGGWHRLRTAGLEAGGGASDFVPGFRGERRSGMERRLLAPRRGRAGPFRLCFWFWVPVLLNRGAGRGHGAARCCFGAWCCSLRYWWPLLCQRWSGEICGRKTGATGARRQRYCYYLPPRRCCPEKRDGAPGSGDWGWQSLALECPC